MPKQRGLNEDVEAGPPVKKERAPRGERAKKVPVKKEPKFIKIYYRLLKDKVRDQQPDTAAPEEDDQASDHKPEGEMPTEGQPDQIETPKPAPDVEQIDTNGAAAEKEDSEGFTRSVKVTEKARVKQLTKQILEDLELQNMCAARLFFDGEHHVGDMDVVKDLGHNRCEVQVYYTLHFAVAGKGSSYQKSIEVSPNDTLALIHEKVPFYKMFASRRYAL